MTIVISRLREQYLPQLVMGGHQKVKQLLAHEETAGAVDRLLP